MHGVHLGVLAAIILSSHLAVGQTVDLTQQGLQAPPMAMIEDARTQYGLGNLEESAKDLGSASTLMKLEASTYQGADRAAVEGFAAGLDQLAKAVRNTEVKTVKDFNQAVVDLSLAKASFHVEQATKALGAQDAKRTSYELLTAAHAAEHGWAWTGEQVSAARREVLTLVKKSAGKLLEDKGWVTSEIQERIRSLAQEVESAKLASSKARKAAH